MKNEQLINRKSSLDLLKIIAIFLICLAHANQTMQNVVAFEPYGFSNCLSIVISSFGRIGNALFIICSSYFIVDKSMPRKEKIINILLDSTTISIIFLISFLLSGQTLSKEVIFHQILPDIYATNWFIPCYIVFYTLSPFIAYALKHLNIKVHFAIIVFSFLTYGLLSFLNLSPVGSELLQFFYILNIVAFIKWHCPKFQNNTKINLLLCAVGISLSLALHLGFALLSNKNIFFERFQFTSLYSPILIIGLISLFNLFAKLSFQNKVISYLSTCSLFVYVIHENYLLRTLTRVGYYNYCITNYSNTPILLFMFVCGIFMFAAGFAVAIIYKETLHRLTLIISIKIAKFIDCMFNMLCMFFKIDIGKATDDKDK